MTRGFLPVKDLLTFNKMVSKKRAGREVKEPEWSRLYRRLYYRLGGILPVYWVLGLPPLRRKRTKMTITEAEQILISSFKSGEVKTIREFTEKYRTATRLLRLRYRFLSEAVKSLLPNYYPHRWLGVVTKEDAVRRLQEIAKKRGRILLSADGRGLNIPKSLNEIIGYFYGSVENAAKSLGLPYQVVHFDGRAERSLPDTVELLQKVRSGKINITSTYRLFKELGTRDAQRLYRALRLIGKGDYREGLKVVLSYRGDLTDLLLSVLQKRKGKE